tara:strand:+ start:215 stop:652 length:438 start_codon:yes stop_codon:yes gene_type:complete
MKSIDNYIKIFLTLIFCISAHGKTKFTDRQVAMMIPKYFARDHNAPKITRTRVYGENGKKILHLNIEVNRNRYENQMEYALSAMASVSQHAARPFDTFVLIMEQNSRQVNDEKVEAKAKCTIDHFIFKRVKNDRWVKKCLNVEEI